MSRLLLLTTTIVITITLLPSPTVQTQQPEKDQLPNFKDYPEASANCKRKVTLAPFLTHPEVAPQKSRCRLSVYNCKTDTTDVYLSAPRPSGTVDLDCSDYERDFEKLKKIELCCDCEEQKTPPWFEPDGCEEPMRAPDPYIVAEPSTGGVTCTVTYTVCSLGAFEKREKYFSTGLRNSFRIMKVKEAETFCASKGYGKDTVPDRAVCCKKWRQAVADWVAFRKRYGPPESRPPGVPPGRLEPCSPSIDADCDGIYNHLDPTPLGDCATYPVAASDSP